MVTDDTGTALDANGDVSVAETQGSTGTVTLSEKWNMGTLTVGGDGTGVMKIQNGATVVTTTDSSLGEEVNGDGTIYVANSIVADDGSLSAGGGNQTSWTMQTLTVGGKGTGSLVLEDGAKLTISTAGFAIGDEQGSHGEMLLNGATTQLSYSGEVEIGKDGTGTFTINNGAMFSARTNFRSAGVLMEPEPSPSTAPAPRSRRSTN